jgi:hypothetical protein
LSYDPETRLLLGCLAATEDEDAARRLQSLSIHEIDWAYILRFSQRNELTPILYHNFRKFGIAEYICPEIRQTFERTYHGIGFRNALYYDELRNLLTLFGEAGIKIVVLKGAAITDAVFKNVALRQMADIDLLIQKHDIDGSTEILSESGYVPIEHHHTKEWYRAHHHHLVPYIHPDKGFVVEMHHHIIPQENPFGIDSRPLWERAQPAKIMDVRTLVLSSEDLIIHLCLHLAYLGAFSHGLKNVIDIVQVLRYHGLLIDWDWIKKEALEHHYIDYIYYPLCLAKKLFDANIETNVLDAFKQCSKLNIIEVSLLTLMTKNILLKDDASLILPKGYLAEVCRELLHDTPAFYKMRSLVKRVLHPPDFQEKGFLRSSLPEHSRSSEIQRIAGIFLKTFRHAAGAIFRKERFHLIFLGLLAELLMSVNI